LDGTASTDSDDGIASYLWSQVEGDPVSLSDPSSAVTTFAAPKTDLPGKNFKLKLTVKDHGGLQGTADSSIYVIQKELPTLNSVTIAGSAQVNESSGEQYTLTANYSDGSSTNVTSSAIWSENSGYASIGPSGYLTTRSVASDQSCSITATYEGKSDVHNITIKNVPPTLNSVTISGSTQVNESSGEQYTLTANYSDGSSTNVTSSASWSENSGYASISPSGYLTTSSVASDQSCSIMASYEGQSDVHNITIKNVPTHTNNSPSVDFSYVALRKIVKFIDRSTDSDGAIVSWFWNFGDGKTSKRQNPWHRYLKIGNYSVTLTVTDSGGIRNTTSKNITVTR
jgi:chitodextrinase